MKNNKKQNSTEEYAIQTFADLMIEKIKSLTDKDAWDQPWLPPNTWPCNLDGRKYNGSNAFMLMLATETHGYQQHRWGTFASFAQYNKEGESELRIRKGEHGFPIMFIAISAINKNTKEKINYDEYKKLSPIEQEEYFVSVRHMYYRVFNIDQTNMIETRPELYKQLMEESLPLVSKEKMDFPALDEIIQQGKWICPIRPQSNASAYYSISQKEIIVPLKQQFKNDENFYTTVMHEMAHSTGAREYLNRLKPSKFGSDEYAREELVAEMTAALTANRHGLNKSLKKDSATYLKAWLKCLEKDPDYIRTVLSDVRNAYNMIEKHISEMENSLQKNYYSSVAYLQGDDTTEMYDLMQKQEYQQMLMLADQYDSGDDISQKDTFSCPTQYRGDDLVIEDNRYAIVYNNSVGGTFDILRKINKECIKNAVIRYGLDEDASEDVRRVSQEMEDNKMAEDLMEEDKFQVSKGKNQPSRKRNWN